MATATQTPTTDTTRASHLMMDPNAVTVIGIDTKDGPEHPLYDTRIKLPIDRGLVDSIKLYGVVTPVIAKTDGPNTLCVDGRRRTIHARIASAELQAEGLPALRIPVVVKKGDDLRLFGVARTSNACRVDDSPIVNAQNATRMLDMGAQLPTIAVTFGVTEDTVKEWLKLLDTTPEIQAQLHTGEIPATVGLALATMPRAEQNQVMSDIRTTLGVERPTGAQVTEAVRARQGKAPSQTPKARLDRAIGVIEQVAKLAYGYEDGVEGIPHAALVEALNKLSLAVMSTGLAKVCKAVAKELSEESAEESAKAKSK